jgi:hypothetical protein
VIEVDGNNMKMAGDLVIAVLAVLTPTIIAGIKKLKSDIPGWVLPLLAPVIGIAIKAGSDFLGVDLGQFGYVEAAAASSAGVMVREGVDQAKKRYQRGPK